MSDMDADTPLPSIEAQDQQMQIPASLSSSRTRPHFTSPSTTSLLASSPSKTPYRTPPAYPTSPTAKVSSSRSSSFSSLRHDQTRSPVLHKKISSPNLNSRGTTPSRQPQFRRSSSNLNPSTPTMSTQSSSAYDLPERPVVTAASVAKGYFQRELDSHSSTPSKAVVIVHDSCYGHRFSRPRATKAALASIVERPERIHATLLGASTAYVRLGSRHKGGLNEPHPDRDVLLSPPPFIFRKTSRSVPLTHPAVTHVHGTKWMEELQIMCDTAETKLSMNGKELVRPIGFGKDEKGNALPKLHEGDLYLAAESLAALQGCLGGVCEAVDTVFQSQRTRKAFVCIRPPGHHCSSNYPSGFCWLNNVHVGIGYAAMNHGLTHAAIIDFDLHHGDGSQTIAWDHNRTAQNLPKNAASHKKTPIGYYSLHDINSYPCEWGDEEKVRNASVCIENAHGQSIWNVHLEPWKDHEEFWRLYKSRYSMILDKTRSFLQNHSDRIRRSGGTPKSTIFISAGFDASEWEGEGMQRHKVNVPTDFYARFTSDIVKLAAQAGLGVDGRVISVLEGGYSDRALTSGVLSHICGLTDNPISKSPRSESLLFDDMKFQSNDEMHPSSSHYNPSWWKASHLESLELMAAGYQPPPPPPPKRLEKIPGTYSSPTHASTAKMTEVARERRSLSALVEMSLTIDSLPPEPPPEVDWATAAYELSRLLIPADRQTRSCTHEDLNAEATRVRRERQSTFGVAETGEPKMQLRDRRYKTPAASDPVRTSSRTNNRRTTIAAVGDLPDPHMKERSQERPRRRSSAASSILSTFQSMKLEEQSNPVPLSDSINRQESVLPMGPPQSLLTKQPKAPTTRKPVSRTSSPRKAASSAIPLRKTLLVTEDIVPDSGSVTKLEQTTPNGNTGAYSMDNMDALTNGMKKVSIKLKMPTSEEYIAKQKATDEVKQKKPRAPRKPTVPKVSKAKAAPMNQSEVASSPVLQDFYVAPSAGNSNLDVSQASSPAVKTIETNSLPMSAVVRPVPQLDGVSSVPKASGQSTPDQQAFFTPSLHHMSPPKPIESGQLPPTGSHTPHDPISDPSSESNYTQTNLNIQRMQSFSSPIKPLKRDLPIFTSSSPIPFAPSSHTPPEQTDAQTHDARTQSTADKESGSSYEIPETPRR